MCVTNSKNCHTLEIVHHYSSDKVARVAFLWLACAVSVAITGTSVPERCVGAGEARAEICTCTVKCNAKKEKKAEDRETRMYWTGT